MMISVSRAITLLVALTSVVALGASCGGQDSSAGEEIEPATLPVRVPPLELVPTSPAQPRSQTPEAGLAGAVPSRVVAPEPTQTPRETRSDTEDTVDVSTRAEPGSASVAYTGDEFVPPKLEIEVGDEVVFVNESGKRFWPASNIHPTHDIYPEFDPEAPIPGGEQWKFTFDEPGFWRYHNHLAPAHSGLVIVRGERAVKSRLPTISREDLSFKELGAVSVEDTINLDSLVKTRFEEVPAL